MGHRKDYVVDIIRKALSTGGAEKVFDALDAKYLLPGSSSRSDAVAMEKRFKQCELPAPPYGPHLRGLPRYYPLYWVIVGALGEEYVKPGMSLRLLAKEHKISYADMQSIIVDSGVKRREQGWPHKDK